MSNLIRFSESTHWYTPDGKPDHDADLRGARKKGLYASPTSIDKAQFVNDFLENWKKEQVVVACLDNPRQPHETPEDYANRVYELSLEKSRSAAEFGNKVHAGIETYPYPAKEPEVQPWIDQFGLWYNENIKESLGSEVVLIDHDIGVAGKCDKPCVHKIYGRAIVDYKTQGIKPDEKGRKAPVYYPSWLRQLAFYCGADAKRCGMWPVFPAAISLVIDSTEAAPPYMKVWEPEAVKNAYKVFVVAAWRFYNGDAKRKEYWPVPKWDLVPTVPMPF
jgi:hypothetical protein